MSLSNFSTNRVLHGTEGRCLVDSEVVCAIQSCEAKLTMNFEDVNVNGNYVTQHRYTSCAISGSISVHKHDSYMLTMLAMTPTTGVVPAVTIEFTMQDPQTGKSQHVALYNCQFEEMALGGFENASLVTEDWAFNAGGYEILDTID